MRQYRHFLVKAVEGQFHMREIDAAIAQGIEQFGITVGQCATAKSEQWIFYFLHQDIPHERANEIAKELVQEIAPDKGGCQ